MPSITSLRAPAPATVRSPRTLSRSVRCAATDSQVINKTIGKDQDKVVNTVSTKDIEKQAVYCRCWKSGTFPMCNGAHNAHNKETGDNVGPLIIKKEE